jgi:hypothetical protein
MKYVQDIFRFQRVSSWSKGDKDKKDKEDKRKDCHYNNNKVFLERRLCGGDRSQFNYDKRLTNLHDSMRGSSPNVMRVFIKHFLCSCRQKDLIFFHLTVIGFHFASCMLQ